MRVVEIKLQCFTTNAVLPHSIAYNAELQYIKSLPSQP
jgi:hypothetical protein